MGVSDIFSILMKIFSNWNAIMDLIRKIFPPAAAAIEGQRGGHALNVKWVQEAMNELLPAKPPLKVDGNYGSLTMGEVKKYQAARGLEPDGWVGFLTLAKIEEEWGQRHPRA